jgi:hypothetical protein
MRVLEYVCKNEACPGYQDAPTMTADEKLRCECGALLELAIYPLQVVWTGPITAKYLDRSKEGGNKADGGHWVWDKETKPGKGAQAHYIETWSQQKEHCRRNGLALPSEMPNNYEVAEDGRTVKNGIGLPGCEV